MSKPTDTGPEHNPFRSSRTDCIPYQPLNTDLDAIMKKLKDLNYRCAITGPHGYGKTTLMENIMGRFIEEERPIKHLRLNLNFNNQRLLWLFRRKINDDDIILLDGADLINPLAWVLFKHRTRHAAGLIITSHREGTLPTLISCTTTPELQWKLISKLAGNDSAKLKDISNELFKKHEGNIRHSLRELYDLWTEDSEQWTDDRGQTQSAEVFH